MGQLDSIVFGDKKFSDILHEIYENQTTKKQQISSLISELKPLIQEIGDATLIVPLIKEYLEISVKNDEQLIKMATIIQRAVNSTNDDGGLGITEEEKSELLAEMAKLPTGLSSLNKIPNSTPSSKQILAVRVKHVLLNGEDTPISWEKYGKYQGMGGILFEEIANPGNNNLESLTYAKPLYSNIKLIPTVNEIVYVMPLPNSDSLGNPSAGIQYYYFQSINIWNSVHHNALPNSLSSTPTNAQKYEVTEAGVEIQSDISSNSLGLGITFKERNNIRNLQPFEGDIIYEGRQRQMMILGYLK